MQLIAAETGACQAGSIAFIACQGEPAYPGPPLRLPRAYCCYVGELLYIKHVETT